MSTPDYRHGVLAIALLMMAGGAVAAVWAGFESNRLTGEWLGFPLPDDVAAAAGIGLLSLAVGLALLVGYIVVVFADRPGVRGVLQTEVLEERHPLARLGRQVIRAKNLWDTLIGVLLLGAVIFLAFHDRLTAIILGVTGFILFAIYVVARRAREAEGDLPDD